MVILNFLADLLLYGQCTFNTFSAFFSFKIFRKRINKQHTKKSVLSSSAPELSRISEKPNNCVQSVHQLELHLGVKIRFRHKAHKTSVGISA